MRSTTYKYSILKYIHSAFLGESINIGILLYFPEEDRFIFKYSKNLKRIKSSYELKSEKIIRHYLQQIERKIRKISQLNSNNGFIFERDLDEFISRNILPNDETSLQFSKSKTSKTRFTDLEEASNSVAEKLLLDKFIYFQETLLKKTVKPINKFYNKLNTELNLVEKENKKLFFKDYQVTNNENGKEFKFEYGWQNGSLNLIKSINLNQDTSDKILNITFKHFGLFTALSDEAKRDNLRYDLFVSKPSEKSFFRDYDYSLSFLDNLSTVRIVEEEEIDNYTKKAIKALSI
ncbi:DUF3037 domain-containing protein [Tenacibaculum sp. 190524A05c]|uniref:DUF3037 domain-containing protein n=1 Tax=Tenacibaculum platacis TaxID=3137852 RepID=UPI0031FADAC9